MAGIISAPSQTDKLPQKAQDFIKQHFSSDKIDRVEEESLRQTETGKQLCTHNKNL